MIEFPVATFFQALDCYFLLNDDPGYKAYLNFQPNVL